MARVNLFFKNGDLADEPKYRLGKALQKKLVANQLYQHMVDSRLSSPAQSAYRRLHSTVTHSLEVQMIGTVVWILGSLRILLS